MNPVVGLDVAKGESQVQSHSVRSKLVCDLMNTIGQKWSERLRGDSDKYLEK